MHDDEIVGGETVNSLNRGPEGKNVQRFDPNPALKDDDVLEMEGLEEEFHGLLNAPPTMSKVRRASTPTHHVSLSVMICTPEEHRTIFGLFTEMLEELSDEFGNVMLHSVDLAEDSEDEPESLAPIREEEDWADEKVFKRLKEVFEDYGGVPEHRWSSMIRAIYRKGLIIRDRSMRLTHNDETLNKVRAGLIAAGLAENGSLITDCVNQMQNQGILFRERASD